MATTKKDFEGIAEVFRYVLRIEDEDNAINAVLLVTAYRVADYLATTNPRFNRDRFLAACKGADYTDANGRTWRYSK
jgi:hypothetical protein